MGTAWLLHPHCRPCLILSLERHKAKDSESCRNRRSYICLHCIHILYPDRCPGSWRWNSIRITLIMKKWCFKWLPILFGCHCRDDRSFHYKGKKFPICARCTGELFGILAGIFIYIIFRPNWQISYILLIPMILDGFIQNLTPYESTNLKRVITGFAFGCGFIFLFLISSIAAVKFGFKIGRSKIA